MGVSVAAAAGAALCLGIVLIVAGLRRRERELSTRPSTGLWVTGVERWRTMSRGRQIWIAVAVALGPVAAAVSGWRFSTCRFYSKPAAMPGWMQAISACIPMTYILEVLRGSFVKGAGFADLAQPLIILAAFGVVIFTSAVLATRRRITS